ncbi:MAG: PPC domain-containing protein, partial [Isosphaeraceae bacterium]
MTTNRRRTHGYVLAFHLTWLSVAQPSLAQRRRQQGGSLPQPNLQSVFPTGVTPGGSAEITLRGGDLEGVTTLWFDHPGLRAFHLKGLTFRVVCATGTPQGYHDVRAVGTYGISNPRTIVIGDRGESSEAEPNDKPALASPIAWNSVVNGEIGPADLDHFVFEGKRGQRLRLDLEAERIDSRLDATLRVLDDQGREIAESRDALGADPSLDLTLPDDGRYVVKVHDVLYRGSNEYPYRLTLTDGPWIEAAVPHVLKPGETATVTLYGQNLGGERVPEIAIDGRVLERKQVTIQAPTTLEADPDDPTTAFVGSTAARRRGFDYVFESPAGRSNPVFFSLATDPIVVEREPNDGDSVQEVTVPCEVAGRFDRPGDLDVYRFSAKKGEVLWVEANAERIGSTADPVFVIQKVDAKGTTSDLATGDDLADKGGQARFMTATVDAAVRWSAPDDGIYQVAINDLYSSQRGDVRLAYRLNIRPERPDFALFLLPDSPNLPDALTLNAGGRGLAYVFAARVDGFNGPVRVEALNLPPGVRCAPVTIPPDQSLVPIVFDAAEDAKPVLGTVQLVGRGRYGDRKESLAYVSGASRLGPDVEHLAMAGGVVWPGDKPNVAPARLTRGFALKVLGPSPITLKASPDVVKVTPGGLLTL